MNIDEIMDKYGIYIDYLNTHHDDVTDFKWEVNHKYINKEELKKKINNIKNIYKDVEGREIPGERYTYYETITFAKLHHLLDELLEE